MLGARGAFPFFENELLELLFSIGVVIGGLLAFTPQLFANRNFTLTSLFLGGFTLLKISEFVMFWVQLPILIIGVMLIACTHYLNIRSKSERT